MKMTLPLPFVSIKTWETSSSRLQKNRSSQRELVRETVQRRLSIEIFQQIPKRILLYAESKSRLRLYRVASIRNKNGFVQLHISHCIYTYSLNNIRGLEYETLFYAVESFLINASTTPYTF